MTREEINSCIRTIEMLKHLAYNVNGVMDVIDKGNCDKIIGALEKDVPDTNVGEWIPMYNGKLTGGAYWFSCAKCKRVVPDVRNGDWEYCPRCGKRNILIDKVEG